MLKILVIGSGAREHAIISKITQSPVPHTVHCFPGNAACSTSSIKGKIPEKASIEEISSYCQSQKFDLVIVGPETQLAEGLADALQKKNIACFGPIKAAAQVETSKAYAKNLMAEARIPTAKFELCEDEKSMLLTAKSFLEEKGSVVLKASGLAAGKGVFVCQSYEEVLEASRHFFQTSMKSASSTIVVEETLQGRESSYFNFVGQDKTTSLGFAVDYKRLLDNNKGPNTGGMGCYSPVPWLPKNADKIVEEKIVYPLLEILKKKNINYCGWLYTGLMWNDKMEPYVVEFNCRLGDPETQVLSLADKSDWLQTILYHCGISDSSSPKKDFQPSVCVVLTSKGYPFGAFNDQESSFLDNDLFDPAPNSQIYGAGLKIADNRIKTSKGRVLSIVKSADSLSDARQLCYKEVDRIQKNIWSHCHYRTDIARDT